MAPKTKMTSIVGGLDICAHKLVGKRLTLYGQPTVKDDKASRYPVRSAIGMCLPARGRFRDNTMRRREP